MGDLKISFGFRVLFYWLGSLDFSFLVEIKKGFPLNPQKAIHFVQGGSTATKFSVALCADGWLKPMTEGFLGHKSCIMHLLQRKPTEAGGAA